VIAITIDDAAQASLAILALVALIVSVVATWQAARSASASRVAAEATKEMAAVARASATPRFAVRTDEFCQTRRVFLRAETHSVWVHSLTLVNAAEREQSGEFDYVWFDLPLTPSSEVPLLLNPASDAGMWWGTNLDEPWVLEDNLPRIRVEYGFDRDSERRTLVVSEQPRRVPPS
jgi:hypothetical protein